MDKEESANTVETNVEATPVTETTPVVENTPVVETASQSVSPVQNANGSSTNIVTQLTDKVKNDSNFRNIVIAVAAVVAVLIVALCGMTVLGGGSTKVAKDFGKYYVKGDSAKLVKLMHEEYLDYFEDSGIDMKKRFKQEFSDNKDDDIKYVSYKILDSEKLTKHQLEDVAEELDDMGIDEDTVKAAVVHIIKFRIDNDGERESEIKEVTSVKIKGKWYMFLGDLS